MREHSSTSWRDEGPSVGDQLLALAATALEHIPTVRPDTGSTPPLADLTLGVMTAAVVGGLLEQVCAQGVALGTDTLVTCERLTRALLGLTPVLQNLGDDAEAGALELLASDAGLRLHLGLRAAYQVWAQEAA